MSESISSLWQHYLSWPTKIDSVLSACKKILLWIHHTYEYIKYMTTPHYMSNFVSTMQPVEILPWCIWTIWTIQLFCRLKFLKVWEMTQQKHELIFQNKLCQSFTREEAIWRGLEITAKNGYTKKWKNWNKTQAVFNTTHHHYYFNCAHILNIFSVFHVLHTTYCFYLWYVLWYAFLVVGFGKCK